MGNKLFEVSIDQIETFPSKHFRPAKVQLADRAIGIEGKISGRGKVV